MRAARLGKAVGAPCALPRESVWCMFRMGTVSLGGLVFSRPRAGPPTRYQPPLPFPQIIVKDALALAYLHIGIFLGAVLTKEMADATAAIREFNPQG